MQNLTLFVMTKKGLAFTRQAVTDFQSIIAEVVIGTDASVANDYASEIAAVCAAAGVRHCYRKDFAGITSEYAMAISWRWLIDHPAERLVVFHDSLLPRYRGFAPLVNALINGETRVGVTALLGASEYDRGDILHQSGIDVHYPIKIAEAIDLITDCYLRSGVAVLRMLALGQPLQGSVQDHQSASYSLWRDEDDYRIDWRQSAAQIRRLIDALGYPYKGASSLCDGVAIRISAAEELGDVAIENRTPGKVIFMEQGLPVVVCGKGLLKLLACTAEDSGESLLPMSRFRLRLS